MADARASAQQMIADADHEVRRLRTVRDETHAALDALQLTLRAALEQSLLATSGEPDRPPAD
jgi:hypothetical protein